MKKQKFTEEIVEELYKEFERRKEERKALELQWRLNMNFLAGNQHSEITPNGDIADFGKFYFWQEREVYNHIAPIIETRIAKLGRVKCSVSVRPFSSDESDRNSAKLSTQILRAATQDLRLSELVGSGCMWSEICGSVFYKVFWSGLEGKAVGSLESGKQIREGDARITVCPPYEIFPDSLTRDDIDECRSIMHAKAYHIDEIKEIWGVDVEKSETNLLSIGSKQLGGGLGYSATLTNFGYSQKEDHCLVIENYEKPTAAHPNGRLTIVAGGKLLFAGELPYINGLNSARTFPFVKHETIKQVGNFFGVSLIERMIPLQRSYNAVKNRKHEYMNRIAMGVLAVEDGSIDIENLEEEGLSPGKILVYRQGGAIPRMLNMGSVPAELTIEEERILKEFLIISGVSEFSRYGSAPTNMTSGIALSLLAEQDDTRISITAEYIRHAIKRIGGMILRLYKQFAIDGRLVRIAGDNGDIKLQSFKVNDLASDDLTFDTENELSDTPANRKNMVVELVKLGILNDENGGFSSRTKLKVLEMLGFGNWEDARDIDEFHRNKAMRESNDLSKIMLLDVDNHHLHIEEHTKAVLSLESSYDKNQLEKLLQHINNHKALLERELSLKNNIKEDNYAGE